MLSMQGVAFYTKCQEILLGLVAKDREWSRPSVVPYLSVWTSVCCADLALQLYAAIL